MSELLNSGQVGMTVLRNLSEQRKQIVKNWENSGLLEGIAGQKKANIAQLLENQASHMLNEVTLDSSAGRFDTVAFPMVRRIFSRLLASEIVSVQPLALPSGLLFYMDAQVSSDKVAPYSIANSGGGSGPTFPNKSAYERFYDNRGYDASWGVATQRVGSAISIGSGSTTTGLIATAITLSSNFDVTLNQSYTSLVLSANTAIAYNGVALFAAGQTGVTFYSNLQTYGAELVQSASPGGATNIYNIVIDLRPAPTSTAAYSWVQSGLTAGVGGIGSGIILTPMFYTYNTIEASPNMSELTLRFSSVTVNSITRKMRAHWTPELAQDLEAYHSIDAEAELTALLSEEVAAEIDREIIRDLVIGAMFEARWDYQGLRDNVNFFGTQKDWNQTLITRINEISAQIHKATLRGGANWVICSAEAGAIFDDLEYFHVDSSASPETEKYNLGMEKIGNLGNRYVVYKDPYMPANIVLVGHKGNTFLEAGYVYAPYIPLQLTQTIYDPNDFTPRKGIMTRYAKKMINNRFYGVIYLDNLNTYTQVYS
jgi:hypothetical protein